MNVALVLVISKFCQEAREYGRSWSEYNLDGVGAFDRVETVTGEAGLLTLAHEHGRMVHREGTRHLISRVWLGGGVQDQTSSTPIRRRQAMPIVEEFAATFMRSLDWTEDLAQCFRKSEFRTHVCAFMHLVLFGLYCRLRHLFELIESKDVQTFRRVLYSGCSGDDVLESKETKYLRDAGTCTVSQAKHIVAFWQAGVCGLHSFDQIRDNLRKKQRDDPDLFRWIENAFKTKAFQIDKDWLHNRPLVASYRRKEDCVPRWVKTEVKKFAKQQRLSHLLEIGHPFAVEWIVPRNADENLSELGMGEADSSILTDKIREVWTQPESFDPPITSPSTTHPVLDSQQSDIPQADLLHVTDSVTAIFEPTNQARSVERVAIRGEDMEEDEETEMVPATQIPQVNMISSLSNNSKKC